MKNIFFQVKTRFTLVAGLIIVIVSAALPEIRFAANLDKAKVSVDDQIVLTIEASGKEVEQNMPEPEVPPLTGLRLVDKKSSLTSSSSFRIVVNGKDMSPGSEKKITWRYILAPTAAGTFTLPSFVLNFGGKQYRTSPATIEVAKEAVQNQDVFFQCIPQKREAYVGEQIRCVFRLGLRQGGNAANPKRPMVEEELRKSFWVEDLVKGEIQGRRENIGGILYQVFDIPFALYPIQSGKIAIPPMALQYEELHSVRQRNPFFDDPFFDGFFGSRVQAVAKQKMSQAVTLNILELPHPPSDFSGSVGNFRLSGQVDRTSLPSGEALAYQITLKGNSSLRNIKDPILPNLAGFDVFEPEKTTKTQIENGKVWGTREYKYVMIPQHEGEFTLAPTRYVYFDADSKTYKTLQTPSFSVHVTPGKHIAAANVGRPLLSQQEIRQIGQDIRFIKTGSLLSVKAAKPLHQSGLFWLLQLFPVAAVVISFFVQRKRLRLAGDVGYARKTRSKRLVKKRLAEARNHLRQNQCSAFYAALSKGILGYIGDVLNLEALGMTIDVIRKTLLDAGQGQDHASEIIGLLEKADFARFATSSVQEAEMREDLQKTEDWLNRFEPKEKEGKSEQ